MITKSFAQFLLTNANITAITTDIRPAVLDADRGDPAITYLLTSETPIPLLDGGHLLYYAIELVTGGPVSKQVMLWGQQIGIAALVGLMSLAFYNDIVRLFG